MSKITQASTVNLAILGTLLSSAIGGAVFLTSMNNGLGNVVEELVEVKRAVKDNSALQNMASKLIAVQGERIDTLLERVRVLEQKVK